MHIYRQHNVRACVAVQHWSGADDSILELGEEKRRGCVKYDRDIDMQRYENGDI